MNLSNKIYSALAAVTLMSTALSLSAQQIDLPETEDDGQQPVMEILGIYTPSVTSPTNSSVVYVLVDTKGRELDKLGVTVYDNPNTLVKKSEESLLGKYTPSKGRQVIGFEISDYKDQVLQLAYSYKDDDKTELLPYWHSKGSFDYISDMPSTSYRLTAGWGSPSAPNRSFNGDNNGVLTIVANPTVIYAKGFGVHAKGTVELQPSVLTPYSRVAADMGAQVGYGGNPEQTMSYRIESGNMVLKTTQTIDSVTGAYVGGDLKKSQYVSWDTPINNSAILRFVIDKGTDNRDDNDHVCIGAPRLYYSPAVKSSQTISWDSNRSIICNKDTEVALDAVSSSGYGIVYRIVKGNEFATITPDNKLVINTPPTGGAEVLVDAYQPGDDIWTSSPVVTCTFTLTRGLEITPGESVEISGPDVLDQIVICADKSHSGEVIVKNGIVDVRQIVLKYTFVPGEWNYISFPSDVDINKISDLGAMGFGLNAYNAPAYYIKEFDTEIFATNPDADPWVLLDTPKVKGLKGYIMSIDTPNATDPVEVTFVIDNTKVDLSDMTRSLGLTVDFSGMEVGSEQTLSVASANPNISSNQLRVTVKFEPNNTSSLPINHAKALEAMRYTFVGNHKAIRLTLPDQTPARVVFFDEKGKKMVKAVRYVSPYVIDLQDLKPGKYNMVVTYGQATRTCEIELP